MSEINIDDLLDNMDRFQKEYESSVIDQITHSREFSIESIYLNHPQIEGLYESGKSLFKLKAFLQTARFVRLDIFITHLIKYKM